MSFCAHVLVLVSRPCVPQMPAYARAMSGNQQSAAGFRRELVIVSTATRRIRRFHSGRFMDLDRYDAAILDELQRDGRLSIVDLAEEVGLSSTPCARRL